MVNQYTLAHPVRATGIGVHTRQKVLITLMPAPANTGIVFRRRDGNRITDIPAIQENVDPTIGMSTALQKEGQQVGTIEHLMSAFAGLGVDNAIVEIDAPELPIMDGSAAPFVFLIQSAGLEELSAAKQFIRIKKEIRVSRGDSWVQLKPFNGLRLTCELAYEHPAFSSDNCKASIDFATSSYYTSVSRARTFGFLADYERVKAMGYAAGSSLANSVVFDEYRVINETGLRYNDECARHKVLDAMGDLFLVGGPILGEFYGFKSGHALNHELTRLLLADSSAWERLSFNEPAQAAEFGLFIQRPSAA
jgi:UDP-3-O-[3-hydroxymyristoyl] N-acetylglucosamine deacetylase